MYCTVLYGYCTDVSSTIPVKSGAVVSYYGLLVFSPPMSLEKVWQAILRQLWMYVRPKVNPKDGFDFNEILWSFLDQSRRWGQELQT